MPMMNMFTNWQTSLAGAVLLANGVMSVFGKGFMPGMTDDPGTQIVMGLGLLAAKDASKTGTVAKPR